MAAPVRLASSPYFHVDLITSTVIVVACVLIVYLTSYLYRLTQYRGIKYFRLAFIFFAISYGGMVLGAFYWQTLSLYIALTNIFAGTLGILCLLYSVIHKKLPRKHMDPLFPFAILSAALVASAFWSVLFVVVAQLVLFMVATAFVIHGNLKAKRPVKLYIAYVLLFVAWLANMLANVFMWSAIGMALNIVSALLFVYVLLRVLKLVVEK